MRSKLPRFWCDCVASTTLVAALIVAGGTRSSAQPVKDVNLPAPARGAAAVAALGAHLPEVAKAYGMDAQRLVTLLQTQPSMEVDVRGALLFACDGLAVDPATLHRRNPLRSSEGADVVTATSSVTLLASGGAVDAFQLHSLPGATRTLHLDFDGHVTRGTAWNSAYTGGADIVSAPFDLDGDPSTFNATERAVIESIWKRVAEDYAPFAIDVTTQDPGVESLRKTSSSDTAYGMRVVISPTNWYKSSAGGTAYVGSFSWNTDTPCWVFAGQLGNSEKYMGEAISHEVGHTLGLNHDGVGGASPSEYYFGQGNWAPIMGVGYYVGLTQFSKGDYANPTNTEDDFAVIASHAPVAGDDHGSTLASASVLAGPTVAGGGTIETRSDVDVFRFDTDAGQVALSVVSPANEPDLHMRVELLNSSGQVLLANDPTTMSASFSTSLAAGTYHLRVSGIGFGDPNVSGYTDYGSVGNYIITGSLVPISGQQSPVAQVAASTTSGVAALKVDFDGSASRDPDGYISSYRWDFGNGDTSTAMNPSYTYGSAGGYTAVLTVTDNVGLSSSASVFISVTAPANQAPTAFASVSATSGIAPLQVTFSSAGSVDPDGSIVSYSWNFGDGTTSTSASPSKTYSVAGNFVATLTVKDNLGATGTASIAISVAGDPSKDFDVAQYSLAKVSAKSGVSAAATVVVLDRLGRPVSGVGVSIRWSGVVSGTTSAKTDASGRATITSGRSKKAGTITGTIASLTPVEGSVYVDSIYAAPSSLTIATR
jgi:PKD repeat protein